MPFVIDINLCHEGHKVIKCKKCKQTDPLGSFITHIVRCYGNKDDTMSLRLERNKDDYGILISTARLISCLPQMLVLRINYDILKSRLRNAISVNSIYSRMVDDMDFSVEYVDDVLFALADSNEAGIRCILCGQYYDGFPSVEVCINHLTSTCCPE